MISHHHHHSHDTDSPINGTSAASFRNATGAISPFQGDANGNAAASIPHHHIRAHHHHTHGDLSRAGSPRHHLQALNAHNFQPQSYTYQPPLVRSASVLSSVAHIPRRHLGSITYAATIAPSAKISPYDGDRRGFASTPKPLPRLESNLNSTLAVRVPRRFLEHECREEITERRAIWGTDVYTDDSDVIAACIHSGWFRGAWAEDIDVDLLGLVIDGAEADEAKIDRADAWNLEAPPKKGPLVVPVGMDAMITVLILPRLERYTACTRWGIRSRDWGKRPGRPNHNLHGNDGSDDDEVPARMSTVDHDGVSFMVTSVRFVPPGGHAVKKGGSLVQDEADDDDDILGHIHESSVRDEPLPFEDTGSLADILDRNGKIKGVGMKSWWSEGNKHASPAPAQQSDILQLDTTARDVLHAPDMEVRQEA